MKIIGYILSGIIIGIGLVILMVSSNKIDPKNNDIILHPKTVLITIGSETIIIGILLNILLMQN